MHFALYTFHFTFYTLHFALLILFSKHKKQYDDTWRTYAIRVRRKYETKMESPAWENRKYILENKNTLSWPSQLYIALLTLHFPFYILHLHFALCILHFALVYFLWKKKEIVHGTYAIRIQRKYETKMKSPAWEIVFFFLMSIDTTRVRTLVHFSLYTLHFILSILEKRIH